GRVALQLRRRAAAAEVVDTLQGAGVPLIMFKGFALAEEVYGDLSARAFGDCDILVRPEAVAEAADRLGALGYRAPAKTDLPDLMRRGEHGVSLRRADGAAVDLHWAL